MFVTVPAQILETLRSTVSVYGYVLISRVRSHKYGEIASYPGETGKLLDKMVFPLSHLRKNGCFLQNCELNIFVYPYP